MINIETIENQQYMNAAEKAKALYTAAMQNYMEEKPLKLFNEIIRVINIYSKDRYTYYFYQFCGNEPLIKDQVIVKLKNEGFSVELDTTRNDNDRYQISWK